MTDIQKQKHNIDLADVVQKSGVELRWSRHNMVGLCPLHDEKTPSFFVDTNKQLFFCFGCGAGGDAIDFVRMLYGYTFQEALQHLKIEQPTRRTYQEIKRQTIQQRHNKYRNTKRNALVKDFEEWRSWYVSTLIGIVDTMSAMMGRLSHEDVDGLAPVIRRLSTWKYHLWLILRVGNEELIYELYREQTGRGRNS
jgi:hypothetical protein